MDMRTASPHRIEMLNDLAVRYIRQGRDVYHALCAAAEAHGFRQYHVSDDAEIWQHEGTGEIVNVWTGHGQIGHGYDGFDDNVEWAFEAEAE